MRTENIEVGVTKGTVESRGLDSKVIRWKSPTTAIVEVVDLEVPETTDDFEAKNYTLQEICDLAGKQFVTDFRNARRAFYNREPSKRTETLAKARAIGDDTSLTPDEKLKRLRELGVI
jgi:lipase chaperone LimK